jgi:DNA-binding NtrC family response regulator
VYRFINKPWRNDEMREVVAEAALASEIPVAMISSPETSDSDQGAAANVVARAKPIADQALLMMEKQQDIRHQIRKFCSDQEIMIYYTQNIQQAVAAATSRDSIGVAIIELSENNRNALHTINLLKRARPELITIALTNEFDAHMAVDLINQGQVFKYLAKPLDINGFQRTIEHAFVRHRFLKNNKQASSRYKVETPREKISASIQSFFSKLISAPS